MQKFTLTINGLSEQMSAKAAAGLLERSAGLVLGAAVGDSVRVTCKPGDQLADARDGGARLTEKEVLKILDALGEAHGRNRSADTEAAFDLLQGARRRLRGRARMVCWIHRRARVVWIEGLPVEATGLIVEVLDGEEWQEKSIRSVKVDAAKEAVALAAEMRAVVEARAFGAWSLARDADSALAMIEEVRGSADPRIADDVVRLLERVAELGEPTKEKS
jgi:hypothetical protein